MADGDWRRAMLVQERIGWLSEEGNCGDVVGHRGCHWPSDTRRWGVAGRYRVRGDITRHGGPLGVSAKDHFGVGTIGGHRLDMIPSVYHAVNSCGEIQTGRVVDRIHANRFATHARTQRVDKRLTGPADTRWLHRAPCEHHLHIR